MRLARIVLSLGIAAAAVSLSACAGGAGDDSTPGNVITPVTMSADELQGASVNLVVGQMLNITTGDLAVDSYAGEVEDTAVATFIDGRDDGSATFDPGVEAVGVGMTDVTMTNTDGGIEPVQFTVVVSEGE